jgi:murein DD-endopeptidase MepM/ murein hydrolase activator NlpD
VHVARRAAVIGLLLLSAVFLWPVASDLLEQLPSILLRRSPHEQYVTELRDHGVDRTDEGRAWLAAAEEALLDPDEVAMIHRRSARFEGVDSAYGWRFPVRRGQRLTIDVAFPRGAVFIDLFRGEDGSRLASAREDASRLVHVVRADEELVASIQPRLQRSGPYRLTQRSEATLRFPVEGVTARAIGGTWGEARDGGRRHEGIDIFARRGTPAVAAVDGWVTAQTSNALGGNVVWIWSLRHGVALYYAHLDRHAVSPGDRVRAGDVVGYVGNTGNARGTSPHLHFGVYARPGGAIDPLPYVCDAPCGERLMHPRTLPRDGFEVESE